MTTLIDGYSDSLTNFMKINNSMNVFFQKNNFNEENYEKELTDHISLANLPKVYGGEC